MRKAREGRSERERTGVYGRQEERVGLSDGSNDFEPSGLDGWKWLVSGRRLMRALATESRGIDPVIGQEPVESLKGLGRSDCQA